MKHEFVEIPFDKNLDGVIKVEECIHCDVFRWTTVMIRNKKLQKCVYLLEKGTQYADMDQDCSLIYYKQNNLILF